MSLGNQWLEGVFPTKKSPFYRGHSFVFRGCTFHNQQLTVSKFASVIMTLEILGPRPGITAVWHDVVVGYTVNRAIKRVHRPYAYMIILDT